MAHAAQVCARLAPAAASTAQALSADSRALSAASCARATSERSRSNKEQPQTKTNSLRWPKNGAKRSRAGPRASKRESLRAPVPSCSSQVGALLVARATYLRRERSEKDSSSLQSAAAESDPIFAGLASERANKMDDAESNWAQLRERAHCVLGRLCFFAAVARRTSLARANLQLFCRASERASGRGTELND